LAKRALYIFKPNQEPTVCRLANKYDAVYPLSASHVLLTSRKDIVIYDTVYGILQSRLEFPNSHTAIINTSDPSSFYAVSISENQTLVVSLTVPATSALLDVVGKEHITSQSTTNPPVLLAPKRKITTKEATKAVKELFQSLKTISAAQDSKAFDKRFKEFRKLYKANRGEAKKMTKLTPLFVKELLSLIFVNGTDGLSIQVYPEKSLDFLLRVGLFSKDLLPGGAEQLVPVALGNPKFLTQLLKTEPTPFTYGDYLVLVKHILDTADSQPAVPQDTILEAFERDVDKFFDRPDMKTVLSNDQLQQFLQLLIQTPETVSYPSLLATVIDSIGLGPLLLTQSLPTELFETLQSALDVESKSIANCLETSSALSLILHRQNDIPLSKQRGRELLYGDRKRKLGQTGWVQMIAEEGGAKKRNNWMKKPTLPGSGVALTSRFIATAKFQEAPAYSLDRMIL
jgi:Utp8 family